MLRNGSPACHSISSWGGSNGRPRLVGCAGTGSADKGDLLRGKRAAEGSDEVVLEPAVAHGVQGEAVEAAAEQPTVAVTDRDDGEAVPLQLAHQLGTGLVDQYGVRAHRQHV